MQRSRYRANRSHESRPNSNTYHEFQCCAFNIRSRLMDCSFGKVYKPLKPSLEIVRLRRKMSDDSFDRHLTVSVWTSPAKHAADNFVEEPITAQRRKRRSAIQYSCFLFVTLIGAQTIGNLKEVVSWPCWCAQRVWICVRWWPLYCWNNRKLCYAIILRLKYILKLLKRDDVPREDLIKNVQYISKVIAAAYKRESRYLLTMTTSVFQFVCTTTEQLIVKLAASQFASSFDRRKFYPRSSVRDWPMDFYSMYQACKNEKYLLLARLISLIAA